MGTTPKIIFGSILAISIVVMFLAFSMQKSAQLTLNIEDVKQTVQKKEQQIAVIQQNLAETQAAVESAKAKSAVIPELENSIATAEQEKLGYMQQLDELQEQIKKADAELQDQLKEADAHLTEYSRLQEEFKNHQILLADTEKAKISADMQTAQTIEELKAMQDELSQRDEQINQFIADLEQKNRVVQVYKEKLIVTVDEVALLQENDSTDRLNLNVILDELAVKTQIVKELTRRILELGGSADVSGTLADPDTGEEPESQTDDQALLEHLTLENNTLNSNIKEQDTLIQDLQNEIQSQTDLLAAGKMEVEQLQTTSQGMKEELNALRLTEQNNQQQLAHLKTSLSNKENEFIAIQEHALGLSAPLREKIATLEQLLVEATDINSNTLAELNKAETSLADLQSEKEQLTTTLGSTQSSLEEAQQQKAQLENDFQTAETALQEERTALQSVSTEIEPLKLALASSEERFNELNKQHEELVTQLANLNEEKEQRAEEIQSLQSQLSQQTDLAAELTAVQTSLMKAQEQTVQFNTSTATLEQERDTLLATVAEKETIIENLTTQLSENETQLTELQAAAEQESVQQITEADIAEQEQRIARLIEEVAAAKALAETQTTALQTTEEELASLKENAAASATLEEENKKLAATLSENKTQLNSDQEKIAALESAMSSLEKERDQLRLYTVDSDNDGISDAVDKCGDTVQGANVNAQGCEEDTDQDGHVNRLDLCPDTASGSDTDNAGCSSEQSTVVLKGVSFQLGTSRLTANAQFALKHAAIILQNNPDISMEVAGHTDSIGDADSNLRLSTTRAQAVLNYLVAQGVAEKRLLAKGYGSNEPIADNNTNAGRAKNRRVELRRFEVEATQPEATPESAQ